MTAACTRSSLGLLAGEGGLGIGEGVFDPALLHLGNRVSGLDQDVLRLADRGDIGAVQREQGIEVELGQLHLGEGGLGKSSLGHRQALHHVAMHNK